MKSKEYTLKVERTSDGKVLSEFKISSKAEEENVLENIRNSFTNTSCINFSLEDEKELDKIQKDNSRVYGQAKTYDEANVYGGVPRLIDECTIEYKYRYINDKEICFVHYWTVFREERWRVFIDNKLLYEDLIIEPNINDLNLNEKSIENLTDRDFRNDDARCPECDSNDFVFLGDGQYRCKSCGEIFDIDDCKTF